MAPYSAGYPQNDELPYAYHAQATKELSYNFHAPFEILKKYGCQVKRLRSDKRHDSSLEMEKPKGLTEAAGCRLNRQVLSAASIMRMAKMELIQFKAPLKSDSGPHPPKACELDSSTDHTKYIKRAMGLLDAAERFSNQQYDEAEKLLVDILSPAYADHPIERVITSFTHILRERTDARNNKFDLEREVVLVDVEQALGEMRSGIHTCEQRLPFPQLVNFTGVQIILDHAESAERIHFIDIGIKLGSHWIIILHALANRKSHHPLKQLKITAVWTPRDNFEEKGKLLTSFAEYMNLPFVLKILYSEMYALKNDQFELEAGELVAVYMEFCLMTLSGSPPKLEALIKGLVNLSPDLMVVSEIEADASGLTFVDRFDEALFMCCAMFDCVEQCLERDSHFKEIMENLLSRGNQQRCSD